METDSRFTDFILLQAQSAGLFLGQIPHPGTGKTAVNLVAARSVLDCLEMLVAKTKGNLNPEEAKLLQSALLNLTTLYSNIESNSADD
jgi:hypothetical protein